MNKSIFIYIITILFSFDATAQDSNNFDARPRVFGVPDCGEWVSGTRPSSKTWLAGYLSGLNQMYFARATKKFKTNNPLGELKSLDQAEVWMDNWCKANPLETVDMGALMLFDALISKRQK